MSRYPNHTGPTHALWQQPIPNDDWRWSARCAEDDVDPAWFDLTVDDEEPIEQRSRHTRAREVCHQCPVVIECVRDVLPDVDTGIRGGHLLGSRRKWTAAS